MPTSITGSSIFQATITLNNAQIKALPSTPVEILPAPGEGKVILPIGMVFVLDCSAGAYDNVANASPQLFSGASSQALSTAKPSLAWAPGAVSVRAIVSGGEFYVLSGAFDGSVSGDGGLEINAALTLKDLWNGSDYTEGHDDNTLKIFLLFIVVDVGA